MTACRDGAILLRALVTGLDNGSELQKSFVTFAQVKVRTEKAHSEHLSPFYA